MGTLHIANFWECDRISAVAGEAMTPGMVVKVSDDNSGQRKLNKLADTDSALLVAGKYAVVTKEILDPYQVDTSTAPVDFGSHLVSIASGDTVLELRRLAKLEFTPDLLDASLDPSRGGTTPTVGTALAVKGALFCAASVSGAITSPVVGRVLRVFGTKVVIELV